MSGPHSDHHAGSASEAFINLARTKPRTASPKHRENGSAQSRPSEKPVDGNSPEPEVEAEGKSDARLHPDMQPVWDAVCANHRRVFDYLTGEASHSDVGLETVIHAFQTEAGRLQRLLSIGLLLGMFECCSKGPFAHSVGTEEFAKQVATLWQKCCNDALEERQKAAAEIAALGIWDAGEDDYNVPPRGFLLGTIFCRQFLSSLLADGGVGKTAVRLAQLISLAIGRSLTGEHVFMRCRVLILSLEDSRDELRRRVYALLLHYGITPAEVKGWLYLAAPKGIRLAEMKDGAPSVGPLVNYLETAIRTFKPDIISLDPFVKVHGLEENSNNAVDWACTVLAQMAIDHDIAIDSPHHTNKGLATPGDANRGRGATAHKDAGRLVYTLTPMSQDEARILGDLPETERRSLIRMDSAKVNLTPQAADAKWFRLVSVALGNATERYPHGDHVQAIEPWTPPKMWDGLDSLLLNRVLDDIEAGLANGQRYSNGSAAKDRAAWRVVQNHAPDKSEKQCRDVIATWLRSGLLFSADYDDPVDRKPRSGLHVNAAKRPS